jgi:hypothetical protein
MDQEFTQGEGFDISNITTAKDLLAALRKGNTQTLELGLGELKVPCRLLNASEEAKIVVKAKQQARKENPSGVSIEVFESYEIMKAILLNATSINGMVGFPLNFLVELSQSELAELYDQYITINHTINPNFQEMKHEEIAVIVEGIKKKTVRASGLFTWQLAAVGRYFLENLLPS